MQRYKAVGFDYNGVISGSPRSKFYAEVAIILNMSIEKLLQHYYEHNNKVNRGDITHEDLWRIITAELNQSDKLDQIVSLSDEQMNQPINWRVLNIVDTIRNDGYKTGLLTNNTLEAGKIIHDLGVPKHFDIFHNSAQTGLAKPEPKAFAHFISELQVNPSELIYIDDQEKSLSSAEECGFTGVLFISYEQLVEQLTKMRVI